jgi:hypothetical protein
MEKTVDNLEKFYYFVSLLRGAQAEKVLENNNI